MALDSFSYPLKNTRVLFLTGFSSFTGLLSAVHNVVQSRFRIGQRAEDLDLAEFPTPVKPKIRMVLQCKLFGFSLSSFVSDLRCISGSLKAKAWDKGFEEWKIKGFEYSKLYMEHKGVRRPKPYWKRRVWECLQPSRESQKALVQQTKEYTQGNKILTGVAESLLYLHEECNQRVVHRDVKASNAPTDADLNAKLGEFSLSRIYDHDINPQTIHIGGTLGYLAHELTKTEEATTSTDVYNYDALMIGVVCRRRPIVAPQKNAQELAL
ncbi:putative L-type lectin-domain containing receptor kinase V.1 [Telopea speciosissima]|uniref:putative L-type lectin-domain containing receptor kinase V.1 n=1 Tax=Telopea speciosissima TaxID=54955 RepID=UPI001CC48F7F|nr:putative L-type lectin-domain containing receptor kinase V.1 [Telopea speciosissima]